MKYQPCGKLNQERPPKKFIDCKWDQNRSRVLKTYKLYDDIQTSTVWRDGRTHYMGLLNIGNRAIHEDKW